MSAPNPFVEIGPWNTVGFGGVPVVPLLVEIDGVKTTDEWKSQKSKESSGKVWVFSGTTVDKPKLTFEAVDREAFDDLRRLWEQLKPVPGLGGGSSSTASSSSATPAPTKAIGSPPVTAESLLAQAQKALAGVGSSSTSTTATDGSTSSSSSGTGAAKDNPGPRPPTVSVQNEILAWHGIYAIARGEWDGPKPTATNSWRVILTVVPQEPPKPAGVGAMAPAKPAGGPVIPSSNAGLPFPINGNAAAGAAGT